MAPEIVPTPSPSPRDYRESFRHSMLGMPVGTGNAFIAFSIMAAFPRKTPSWQDLRDRFGMSRATSYRYLAALKAVRGEV